MILSNKGILITGANRGLGKEIARACLQQGANLLLCARDAGLLEETCRELRDFASPEQTVLAEVGDVSNEQDVRRLVARAESALPQFNCIVNNAAILGPKGLLETTDWNEWIHTLEVNLLGTVLVCRSALPIFRRRGQGKIVNLSGGGATTPRPRFSAYAVSKAAIVRFTETLAEETKGSGIDVNAIAPGTLNTRLLDEVVTAGREKAGEEYDRVLRQKQEGCESIENAAALCVFLLSSESDGISGKLISAVWDPWKTLSKRREELSASDIYTLRRIRPEDRAQRWS